MASSVEISGWGQGAWGQVPYGTSILFITVDPTSATSQVGDVLVTADAFYQVNGLDAQAVLNDESVSINVRIIETGLASSTTLSTVTTAADSNTLAIGLTTSGVTGTTQVVGSSRTTPTTNLATTQLGDEVVYLRTPVDVVGNSAGVSLGVVTAYPQTVALPAGLLTSGATQTPYAYGAATLTVVGLQTVAVLAEETVSTNVEIVETGLFSSTDVGQVGIVVKVKVFPTPVTTFAELGIPRAYINTTAATQGLYTPTNVNGVWVIVDFKLLGPWIPDDDSSTNVWTPDTAVAVANF